MSIKIPEDLSYTGYDIFGNLLGSPAGTISNGAGCKFVQAADVSAWPDGFWVSSGTAVRVGHADWLARTNGNYDQVDQWDKGGATNTCCVVKSVLYPEDTIVDFTELEYNQMVRWSRRDCGPGFGEFEGLLLDFSATDDSQYIPLM